MRHVVLNTIKNFSLNMADLLEKIAYHRDTPEGRVYYIKWWGYSITETCPADTDSIDEKLRNGYDKTFNSMPYRNPLYMIKVMEILSHRKQTFPNNPQFTGFYYRMWVRGFVRPIWEPENSEICRSNVSFKKALVVFEQCQARRRTELEKKRWDKLNEKRTARNPIVPIDAVCSRCGWTGPRNVHGDGNIRRHNNRAGLKCSYQGIGYEKVLNRRKHIKAYIKLLKENPQRMNDLAFGFGGQPAAPPPPPVAVVPFIERYKETGFGFGFGGPRVWNFGGFGNQ